MTKPQPAQPAPINEDDVLRRMLNTPPKKHVDKQTAPTKKKAK
jgi:hypothetical protein